MAAFASKSRTLCCILLCILSTIIRAVSELASSIADNTFCKQYILHSGQLKKSTACMQAGDSLEWVCEADSEMEVLIATSAGYLIRLKSCASSNSDLNVTDSDALLVQTMHHSA